MTEKQIDNIEAHIDKSWNQLSIYRYPLYSALFKTLTSFEFIIDHAIQRVLTQYGYESRPAEISQLRESLRLLIPKLFEKCPYIYFNPRKISDLRNMRISFDEAVDAIKFAQTYDWISYHLTGYRQNWINCQIDDRHIMFSSKPGTDQTQSLLHHPLKILRDNQTNAELESGADFPYSKSDVLEIIKSVTKHFGYNELLRNVPIELYEIGTHYHDITFPKPSINTDIELAGYTIKDVYVYWNCFSILLDIYIECCRFKFKNDYDGFRNSLVLSIKRSEIASIISHYSNLPESVTSIITDELTFNIDQQRPDIQIQPLVPFNSFEYVFLTPHLISTANWEVCLLRLWAKKYTDKYGALVASTKVNISHELALRINSHDNLIVENKKIFDDAGNVIAEIDLAIFDILNRSLMISEIKWVIEPDSFQEESHVHQELQKGINQLKRIQDIITKNASIIISYLFPNIALSISDISQINYALISRGSVDSGIDTGKSNIYVLDYQLTLDYLKKSNIKPFNLQFIDILGIHNQMKKNIEAKLEYQELDLAGYRFAIPGFDKRNEKNPFKHIPQDYPLKDYCYCGSGNRYIYCCRKITE